MKFERVFSEDLSVDESNESGSVDGACTPNANVSCFSEREIFPLTSARQSVNVPFKVAVMAGMATVLYNGGFTSLINTDITLSCLVPLSGYLSLTHLSDRAVDYYYDEKRPKITWGLIKDCAKQEAIETMVAFYVVGRRMAKWTLDAWEASPVRSVGSTIKRSANYLREASAT